MVTTLLSRQQPMKVLVALDDSGAATGQLYWDDGESRVVGENYATLDFTCSLSGNVVSVFSCCISNKVRMLVKQILLKKYNINSRLIHCLQSISTCLQYLKS